LNKRGELTVVKEEANFSLSLFAGTAAVDAVVTQVGTIQSSQATQSPAASCLAHQRRRFETLIPRFNNSVYPENLELFQE